MQKTLEKNRSIKDLRQQLALERINRLSAILCYKYGLDTVVAQHQLINDFAIFIICECCGEMEELVRYSAEQLLNLEVEEEIINILEKMQN